MGVSLGEARAPWPTLADRLRESAVLLRVVRPGDEAAALASAYLTWSADRLIRERAARRLAERVRAAAERRGECSC